MIRYDHYATRQAQGALEGHTLQIVRHRWQSFFLKKIRWWEKSLAIATWAEGIGKVNLCVGEVRMIGIRYVDDWSDDNGNGKVNNR